MSITHRYAAMHGLLCDVICAVDIGYLNLFYMSFNPGINPRIYNFNPEIPELDNDPGIAIPNFN